VAFDALPDEKERDYFNTIPTSLYLEPEQVDHLREVAAKLLYTDKNFQRFVTDLGGRMPELKAKTAPAKPGEPGGPADEGDQALRELEVEP
jgi:hypothetical protein